MNWFKAVKIVILTVHISFMLIFNESIATRFPCSLVVDDVNLEQKDQLIDHTIIIFLYIKQRSRGIHTGIQIMPCTSKKASQRITNAIVDHQP